MFKKIQNQQLMNRTKTPSYKKKKANQTRGKILIFVTFLPVHILVSDWVESRQTMPKLKLGHVTQCFIKLNVPCTFRLAILKALWLNSYDLQCSLMSFIGNDIPHSSAFNHQLEARKFNVETVDLRSVFLLPVSL